MKTNKAFPYFLLSLMFSCLIGSPVKSQESGLGKDSLMTIPIRALPIGSVKAVGDKKFGQVTITVEFENTWSNYVDVSLSVGGWNNFGFKTDKGDAYKVHTYYDKLADNDPNKGYKKVSHVQFGSKVMDMATTLAQSASPGQKVSFIVKVTADKTSVAIGELHVSCSHYYQYGGGINSSGIYRIKQVAIDWK